MKLKLIMRPHIIDMHATRLVVLRRNQKYISISIQENRYNYTVNNIHSLSIVNGSSNIYL